MAITALVVLVTLALSILALRGVFGEFPSSWGWFLAIISGLGLMMGTQTVFQALWGRPVLQTEFEVSDGKETRLLLVFLKNIPVKNKVIKKLGVRRETIQSLTAQFRIAEAGSGKVVVPIHQARISSDDNSSDEGSFRIALPPTFSVGASIVVAAWEPKSQKSVIPPDRLRGMTPLEPGLYRAEIILLVDGDPMPRIFRQFVVGETRYDLIWASNRPGA
ncbi:MAG: hypothetical protein Q7T26_10355 [Dehalococcoidia bacterium]|nr:hypothetical protein [Dehalococcoidia bacterium]